MDSKGEMDIVSLPITGEETLLAFIMAETELLEENCVNIFLSQIIWFVAHVSIIYISCLWSAFFCLFMSIVYDMLKTSKVRSVAYF